jgi:hypothetical protein
VNYAAVQVKFSVRNVEEIRYSHYHAKIAMARVVEGRTAKVSQLSARPAKAMETQKPSAKNVMVKEFLSALIVSAQEK